MLGNIAGVLICLYQLNLIHVFEYGIPTTHALALPVIQLNMCALTVLICIQHALLYCASVLIFIVIHFKTEIGYMDLRK